MSDLIARLREHVCPSAEAALMEEAANEIADQNRVIAQILGVSKLRCSERDAALAEVASLQAVIAALQHPGGAA